MSTVSVKLDKKILIKQFVDHLRGRGHPVFQVDKWPDEENRMSPDIDAIAGDFAIEHTSVDTVDNQRTVTAWFMQALGDLKDELQGKLTFRLVLILPYEGIQTGQDWSKIKAALACGFWESLLSYRRVIIPSRMYLMFHSNSM